MYPEDVITITKKGKREVRNYLMHGTFVEYNYLDEETGEVVDNKIKLVLKAKDGKVYEYFIIPGSNNRAILITESEKGSRKILVNNKAVNIDSLLEKNYSEEMLKNGN
jgi:hypothetical protein